MLKKTFLISGLYFLLTGCSSDVSGKVETVFVSERAEASSENVSNNIESIQDAETISDFYRTVSLYDGKMTISIPAAFTKMSEENILLKYPRSSGRPNLVYTNDRTSVNIAFNYTELEVEQEDLPEIQTVLTQQLQRNQHSNFRSSIKNINGSDFIVFEFESQAIDTRIYNLMFATDVGGKLLLATFNCTENLTQEWKPKAEEILASVHKK